MPTPKEIEQHNQKVYEHEYTVDQLSIDAGADRQDFFTQLVQQRIRWLKSFSTGKQVLDIGCGAGDYLFAVKDQISFGYGIDFTDNAINAALAKKNALNAGRIQFTKAAANQLPCEEQSVDLVFSFSALYYMPDQPGVLSEIARVLKPGGKAILEFGNTNSLNDIVCQAYPEYARTCHLSLSDMRKVCTNAGLQILDWQSFQILPYWGKRPGSIKLFLHPMWKRLFQQRIGGRMLDQWMSTALKPFAGKHFIFCTKSI